MLTSYLKLAVKVLARRKFFTFVSLFGICVTLTVLTVVAAIGDHFLAPHAPESKLGRTLGVYHLTMGTTDSHRHGPPGYGFLTRTIIDLPGAEVVSIGALPDNVAVYADQRKTELYFRRVDGNFWQIFDFSFIAGGPYSQDDEINARFVAVINRSTARALFTDPSNALGKPIEIDGQRFRVCGVVEDVPFSAFRSFGDVWAPISTNKSPDFRNRYAGHFLGMVLAKSSAQFPALKAEFNSRLAATPAPFEVQQWDTLESSLDTPLEGVVSLLELPSVTWFTGILIGVALLFMLLPAINLVNLNLSRIIERAPEIGVRRAFGAARSTLVVQFLVENIVLTVLGGVLAFALSTVVLDLINITGIIPRSEFSVNVRVFAIAMAASLGFALLSGVYPAWRMSRLQPVEALRGTA